MLTRATEVDMFRTRNQGSANLGLLIIVYVGYVIGLVVGCCLLLLFVVTGCCAMLLLLLIPIVICM